MLVSMKNHGDIRPGQLMRVNDVWVTVTMSEPQPDNRWRLQWCNLCAIRTRPEVRSLVITPNVRFWSWENGGWVRITLKPGQTLSYSDGRLTDEGHSWYQCEWEYDADEMVVICRSSCGGSDCDGPHEYHYTSWCPVVDMEGQPPEDADPEWQKEAIPVPRPLWRKGFASQRDIYAEMMGY